MKAVLINKYGEGENLVFSDIPVPVPKNREVLVQVHYTTVNDYEWCIMRGEPKLYRLLFGIRKPKVRLGMELSGSVVALGSEAIDFVEGDAVLGDISQYGSGSYAEYLCIDERALRKKPPAIDYKDAACLPHAGLLAYQALQLHGQLKSGQEILVNGAGGGFGTFILQLLKEYNVKVTGIDSAEKLDIMRQLGCDDVFDYKQMDFTKGSKKYDLILDPKTNRFHWRYLHALKTGGSYITIGGSLSKFFLGAVLNPVNSLVTGKKYRMVWLKANEGLEKILDLYSKDKIRPVSQEPFRMEQAAEAIQYFGKGKHIGKVVIQVKED